MKSNAILEKILTQQNKLIERLIRTVDKLSTKVTTIEHCIPDGTMTVKQERTIILKQDALGQLTGRRKKGEKRYVAPEGFRLMAISEVFPHWGYKEANAYILLLDAEIKKAQDLLNEKMEEE